MNVIFGGETTLQILVKNRALANNGRTPLPICGTNGIHSVNKSEYQACKTREAHKRRCSKITKAEQVMATAKLIGLPIETLHAITDNKSTCYSNSKHVKFHICPVPDNCFAFIDCGSFYVASPELCFLQLAKHLELLDLILLGYELCGDYRSTEKRNSSEFQPLTTPQQLAMFINLLPPNTQGKSKALTALKYILPRSASPRESRVALICILPHRLGGYNFPYPALNQGIPGTSKTGDICWLDKHLIIEYDSNFAHNSIEKRTSDSARSKIIGLYGNCTVLGLWTDEANDWAAFDNAIHYAAKIMRIPMRSKKGMEKRVPGYHKNYLALHSTLFKENNHFDQKLANFEKQI